MNKLFLPLYSWDNGELIKIGIFALVIIGLLVAVFFLMETDKKKKD